MLNFQIFIQIGEIKNDKIPNFFESIGKKKIIETY